MHLIKVCYNINNMAKSKLLKQSAIEDQAIAIVKDEKRRWEEATAFVTDRVAFQMRYLIRLLRKNYWGSFDYPTDPATNRKKTWIPLTQSMCENVVKSIDLDTKDINFRAKNKEGYAITDIVRTVTREYLDKERFGEKLNELERNLAIDGTAVWKTIDGKDEEGKPKLIIKPVDLLNIYIDPNENNIQDAYRFTERAILTPSEIRRMDGWMNTDMSEDITGSTNLSRIDSGYKQISPGTTAEYRDVFEMWGKIPKSLLTLDPADEEVEIDGHIVVSGIETGKPLCHLIRENKKKLKPYEECRYSKVANRWYGVGIAERLIWLQIWLNTIVNNRISRSYISQLGLFKIRKGSGITPAMITRLSANGAVLVTDMNDIQPLETPSADPASYRDEEVINSWAQKATSAYDISVGEATPASSTATANSLQDRNAKTAYTLVRESMGQFLERWMNRHAIKIIAKTVGEGDCIRFTDEDSGYQEVIERVVAYEADKNLEEMYEKGYLPTEETLVRELQAAERRVRTQKGVFVKLLEELITDNVDTKVYITNEELDTGVMVNNLIQTLQIAPEYKDQTIKEIFNLMGLPEPRLNKQNPLQPAQNPDGSTQMGMKPGVANRSGTDMVTKSNVATQQGLQ